MTTSFCVKCKGKRTMVGAHGKKTKNGKAMVCGTCGTCGCKMSRFVSKKQAGSGMFGSLLGQLAPSLLGMLPF